MRTIEPATIDDLPQLADLLGELFAMEPDFRPDHAKQLRGLRQIIEQPAIGHILVIRNGGEILGMVNLLFTISTAEGGRAVLLEDFIVRSTHRARGLGSELMRQAIQFAKNSGATRITVLTGRDNSGAIRFYQRHGFAGSSMMPMRLHLGAGA